jgi:hypothetical protein
MTGRLTLAITVLTYLSGNAFELAELLHLSPVALYNNNLTIRRLVLDILYGVSYIAVAVGIQRWLWPWGTPIILVSLYCTLERLDIPRKPDHIDEDRAGSDCLASEQGNCSH